MEADAATADADETADTATANTDQATEEPAAVAELEAPVFRFESDPGSSLLFADDALLVAAIGPDSPPPPPGAPSSHSILGSDGKLYVRGFVPTEQVRGLIISALVPIMGEENIVDEYVVDPTVPFDPARESVTYTADTVLFSPGSSVVQDEFTPLLYPGIALLAEQPTVVIEVVGHTDSLGDDESNMQLSTDRVEAVRNALLALGGDGGRITTRGMGETAPRASNDTDEGRQANRRVEFHITGFRFDG